MFLADLHVHSTFSDGLLTIPQIVDFYGSRGFGAIAITDHLCEDGTLLGKLAFHLDRTLTSATLPLYWEIIRSERERAWAQYRMCLISGVEISKNALFYHRSSHFLLLGVEEAFSADEPTENLLKFTLDQGGVTIAAHPVPPRSYMDLPTLHLWDRRFELQHLFTAWEATVGSHLIKEVAESGLPVVATSDFHKPKHIESWKSVFHCDRGQGAIFDAIRNQDIGLHCFEERKLLSTLSLSA